MTKAQVSLLTAVVAFLVFLQACATPAWAGPPFPDPPTYEPPSWTPPAPRPWNAPASPGYATPTADEVPPPRRPVREVIDEINRRRAAAGCVPVRPQAGLTRAAQRHSDDMARHAHLSHTGSDGSSPAGRARAAGYRPGHSAEIIAAGPTSPSAVVAVWMNSGSHRAILLTCRYTRAGVGVSAGADGPWWTVALASGG
ncbi:CAP domain-containing protein [Streptomyces sp. NPDC050698]